MSMKRRQLLAWAAPVGLALTGCAGPGLQAAAAKPIATLTDLQGLLPYLRGRDVIGLGEATHGSHELFDIKTRLVDVLVEAGLVGTVAFEVGFADGVALDRYVSLSSDADPADVLKATGSFSMANADVLALVKRLRALNMALQPSKRVRVLGYDVQTPGREALLVADLLKSTGLGDKIALGDGLRGLAARPGTPIQRANPATAGPIKAEVAALLMALDSNRAALEARSSARDFADMRQAVQVIGQGFDLFAASSFAAAYDLRDAAGAANVIAAQAVGGRSVVVWAHNGHVNKGSLEFEGLKLLGGRLADTFGPSYYAVATAFFEGEVRAQRGKEGVVVNSLAGARPGSLDAMLNGIGPHAYFADLRQARQDAAWARIVDGQGVLRGVGAAYEPENEARTYRPTNLGTQFDAVVFIRKVAASLPL